MDIWYGSFENEPTNAAWGERYFHIRKPDGYQLSFAKPIAVILFALISSIDFKLAYISDTCNTYPPTIRTIAFIGLENVIIR